MRAIGASWRRAESVRARSGSHFKNPPPAAGPKTADALQTRFLTEPEALGLLAPFGLPYPRHKMAASSGEAVKAADELGYPVVLKLVSPDVPHKSEAGGVMTGLSSAQEVEQAHERIMQNASAHNPEAEIRGVLVCRQARPGLEAIVGAVQDPVFGPTLMFGLGGIHTELFKDVSFRVLPIDRSEAKRMIREIKGFPLLAGFRGQAGVDVDALAELLMTVSKVMEQTPGIRELDLNPVRLYPDGLKVLDVRVLATKS